MFSSLDPSILNKKEYLDFDLFNKVIVPDRVITFDVKWVDDKGVEQTNKG